MHRKSILFVTSGLELTDTVRRVLADMDAAVKVTNPATYQTLIPAGQYDLVIADMGRDIIREMPRMENCLFEDGPVPLLAVVDADCLPSLRLSVRINSDFVMRDAIDAEYASRVRYLLWPGEESNNNDFLRIDDMTVNLATYQVTIAGEPVDLTYLEYALFSFLVTHPGRTYSRDALLRRVWGFEYYGGSRTVDVHVRRIRAKLGPELSQRLETVRGVGYLWNA